MANYFRMFRNWFLSSSNEIQNTLFAVGIWDSGSDSVKVKISNKKYLQGANYYSWGPHHFRAHRPSSNFSYDNKFSLLFSIFILPYFRKLETVEALRNFVTLTKVSSVGRRVQNCAAVTDLSVSPMKIVIRLPQTAIGWESSLKNAAGLRDTSPGLNIPQYFTINYPWNWQFRLSTLKTGSGLKNNFHF